MSLRPEMFKKKTFSLYKAYHMTPGESMVMDPGGDRFSTSPKEAVIRYLETIKDIQKLEEEKGAQLNLLEFIFPSQKIQESDHVDEILQDGTTVEIAVKYFPYRMKLSKYILNDFQYSANPKDRGQTLIFEKLDLTEVK